MEKGATAARQRKGRGARARRASSRARRGRIGDDNVGSASGRNAKSSDEKEKSGKPIRAIFLELCQWLREESEFSSAGTQNSGPWAMLGWRSWAAVLGIFLIVNTCMNLWWSFVIRGFTTALQQKNETAFYHQLWVVMVVIFTWVPLDAIKQYAAGNLSLRLRRQFVSKLLSQYFCVAFLSPGAKNLSIGQN